LEEAILINNKKCRNLARNNGHYEGIIEGSGSQFVG
jgi:hypothetical protein